MNCQSHLGRLFLSSCREGANEFKTADKEGGGGRAGFLLAAAQKSFIRLVMVVQFHQITAEIPSALKNEMKCDFTSRSLLLSVLGSSERSCCWSSGHFITGPHWWEQRALSCLTQRSRLRVSVIDMQRGPSVTALKG